MNKLLQVCIAGAVVLSALPTLAADAVTAGNAKSAEAKISMCIGCHQIPNYKASFPDVYSVPLIKGQNVKYIEAALQAYKKGERNHLTMQSVAKGLSDQDIADIAAYYGAANASTK